MLAILCLIGATSAATTLISENYVSENSVIPTMKLVTTDPITDHWSVFAIGAASPGYGELRVGPVWNPNQYFSFGISGGIEVSDHPWIVAGTTTGAIGRISVLSVIEYGGGYGFWRKEVVNFDLGERIGVGIIDQTGAGIGPRIIYDRKHVGIWAAPMYEIEEDRFGGLFVISINP